MEIIRFAVNVPQEVRLTSLEGRAVDSKFGGTQYLFYAQEGIFYVSEPVGKILMDQFKKLSVKAGDPVEITKAEVGNGTGRKTQWIVTVAGFAAQVDTKVVTPEPPTELEQKLAESIKAVEARKQAQRAQAAQAVAPGVPVKVPMDRAVVDAVRMVQNAMKECGEQWSDQARQDLVSTVLIAAQREGWIGFWRQAETGERNAA